MSKNKKEIFIIYLGENESVKVKIKKNDTLKDIYKKLNNKKRLFGYLPIQSFITIEKKQS